MGEITTLTVTGDINTKVSITAVTDGIEETYMIDAQNKPAEDMILVQASRKQILQSINMQRMFDNLYSCVDLLDITYNAVNGMEGGISKSVAGIQSDYLNVLTDSVIVMQGFEAGTTSVVEGLIKAYGFLTKPIYTKLPVTKNGVVMACTVFEQIKKKAALMRKESEDIAKRYAQVRDRTSATNGDIMIVSSKDYELRQKKALELSQLQAQIEGYQEVKDDLDSEITEYTQRYDKLSKKIDKQEDRAYNLALTSAILGGISSIVGSIIPIAGNNSGQSSPQGGGTGEPGGAGSAGSTENSQATKERCDKSQQEVDALKEKVEKEKKELADIKAQLESLGDADDSKKQELLKKQDQLEREKAQDENKLAAASSKLEVYQQAAGAVSTGLQVTADKFDQMSQKAGDGLEGMYNQLDSIASQKAKLAKERRETILKMATLTKSLEFASTEHHDLEIALNALITAIGCMRLVEVYLADITLFWKNVEAFCGRLIEEITSINSDTEILKDVEDYTVFFYQEDFVKLYLYNMINWVALHSISCDYLNAFNHAFEKQKAAMGKMEKTREEHWKIAQKLAASINCVFDKQLEDLS